MTFQIGEKVVYPNQGVGTIENIRAWALGSQFEKCYLLRMVYGSVTVTVPFSKVANIGLRPITKNTEISRVLSYLATGTCFASSDWKIRFKANSEKMLSGSLLRAAEVFKSLLEQQKLQKDKLLSFREKKMLDRSRHMLVTEISIARGIAEPEAVALLQKYLDKAGLTLPPVL
jgi:CarD family transcriptional regulator